VSGAACARSSSFFELFLEGDDLALAARLEDLLWALVGKIAVG
jgi:hypothetical protein